MMATNNITEKKKPKNSENGEIESVIMVINAHQNGA